jgi:hypothetical protein
MYQMFCKCNPCNNNRSTIEKHKCTSINARFISVDIPIKFPSGLHDTRLTDIDESLTIAPCKGLLISNIQPLIASNSSSIRYKSWSETTNETIWPKTPHKVWKNWHWYYRRDIVVTVLRFTGEEGKPIIIRIISSKPEWREHERGGCR